MSPALPALGSSPWQTKPVLLAFYLLAAATLISFNSLSNMLIGTGWHVTLGLGLASIYLCAVVRVPFSQCLGSPGLLILATLISYLWIGGSVVAFEHGIAQLRDNVVIPRIVLAAALVVATALGTTVALQRIGLDRLLFVVLCLQVITCLAILATPALFEHVYSLAPHLGHVEKHAQYRFLGTFTNPNRAGVAACQGAVTALAFLGSGRHVKSASVALAVAVVAVVLTFSRTAMMAIAAICLLTPLFFRNRHFSKVVLIGVGMVGVVATVAFLLEDPRQIVRFDSLFGEFGGLSSNIRTDWLWPLTLSQIAESPLFGHGVTLHHAIAVTNQCTAATVCSPHSTYLMLWREAGVVPLTLLLLFVATMFCASAKISSSMARNVVVGWVVIFAVNALASDTVLYSTSQAFIMGLSCALICRAAGTQRKPAH